MAIIDPESQPSNSSFNDITAASRADSFETLADGTQDLAALVGLFATDGVERYAIDYTRGFLPPVTAPLSLLGLLGYVRALLKLSLGIGFCDQVGFSTNSLRSYAGVKSRDVAPGEKVVKVNYLEREAADGGVIWKIIKTVSHTEESMPLTVGSGRRALQDRRTYDTSYSLAMCSLARTHKTAFFSFGMCSLALCVAASIASFPVLLCSSKESWTRYFACLGLVMSVLVGGLPWCWIYIQEHLPFESSHWFREDWKKGPSTKIGPMTASAQHEKHRSSLAFFAKEDHFYVFDCRAIATKHLWLARIISGFAAINITIAYICQYIEVRSSSAKTSGIWLGLQGALAILRILAFRWAPKVLGFGTDTVIRWTDQRNNCFKDSLSELEIVLCWTSMDESFIESPANQRSDDSGCSPLLFLPNWLVDSLDSLKLSEALKLDTRLRADEEVTNELELLRNCSFHWDMPDPVFARWLQLRCRDHNHKLQHTSFRRRDGVAAWICRIIRDNLGNMHVLPGISMLINPQSRDEHPTEILLFSIGSGHESTLFCIPDACGIQHWYRGVAAVPDDHRNWSWVAMQTLEPFYQQCAQKLWLDLVSALNVLEFSNGKDAYKVEL